MNKKLEINQYHGLPGAGIIGVQGETGGDGYNKIGRASCRERV